jgi:hypothetical protein
VTSSAFTDEVLAALRDRGLAEEQPPTSEPVPAGYHRFLVAVDEMHQEGVATPAVIAAILRAQADALDQPITRS